VRESDPEWNGLQRFLRSHARRPVCTGVGSWLPGGRAGLVVIGRQRVTA
jgi:hypothetical protein